MPANSEHCELSARAPLPIRELTSLQRLDISKSHVRISIFCWAIFCAHSHLAAEDSLVSHSLLGAALFLYAMLYVFLLCILLEAHARNIQPKDAIACPFAVRRQMVDIKS